MKISYNWLQDLVGPPSLKLRRASKKLPSPEKLADLLTKHSFEAEVSGKFGPDTILDVEVLPNRAHDCLSHQGIAREIAAILKYPFKEIDYGKRIKESAKEKASQLVKVEVKDKRLCPRYTARVINKVKVGPSPVWIQEKIKACGLRPISNVVDIANYVMLETGQPLHAFDADKLKAKTGINKIIVRRAKKGEKIVSLDDEKYDLDENILVIADERDPICVAGVKGGINPGIDNQTKRVILEAANFNAQVIRRASRQLKLATDASWRFEHELDPNLTQTAIDMCAYLIQEIADGQVAKELVDFYPDKIKPKQIILDLNYLTSLLGVKVPDKQVIDILKSLGFQVKTRAKKLSVLAPTRRIDITLPEDLIEEIGRIYGLEKIPAQLPQASLIPTARNDDLLYQNKVKDILANLGFSEVYNYSFISEKDINDFKIKPGQLIELLNPISQEQKYLRPSLAVNLIKNISQNKKYFPEVKLFEMGKVFKEEKNQEIKKLAGAISLAGKTKQAQEFYLLKGTIDSLLNKLRISDVWYDDALTQASPVLDLIDNNQRAEIKIGNDYLGWIGEIKQEILTGLDIESDVAIFELDFEKLVELATEEMIYQTPSKYPAVVRDIALLVEPDTKVVEVMNLMHAAGGALIRDIDLFDIYQGENIPKGKKNFAFHLIFQSDDHTLTDQEINKLMDKIVKALEEEGGWEVRK
ncbi:MAG: phenylalanine--tRNA ligase subunit beta [Patescibacteria group bacterium]